MQFAQIVLNMLKFIGTILHLEVVLFRCHLALCSCIRPISSDTVHDACSTVFLSQPRWPTWGHNNDLEHLSLLVLQINRQFKKEANVLCMPWRIGISSSAKEEVLSSSIVIMCHEQSAVIASPNDATWSRDSGWLTPRAPLPVYCVHWFADVMLIFEWPYINVQL